MKILKATVPPTKDQGSCSLIGFYSFWETAKQNVLWQYNNMRQRDGFPPVKRMPAGTTYAYKAYLGPAI